ncbi:ERAD-associated E3 ubiquitin- ligase component HRD3A [Olea europaea subsp. europaea]|uniref:ERAD-associated E3 ubiquitin- ligase component HRD3A n=1 Tax=Olea europaea subsp. europaea TaxID=158383 RepID=A0A8S0UW81_OLEEU|nr:ERAD-associated E3 ubiquitin- ligase component HRD3A [Olea europaea subsp. europaea]
MVLVFPSDDFSNVVSAPDDANDSYSDFDKFHDSGPEPYYVVDLEDVEVRSGKGYRVMEEAMSEIETSAATGHRYMQSMIGSWYNMGMTREMSQAKVLLYRSFAVKGRNLQSKMALAYTYYC